MRVALSFICQLVTLAAFDSMTLEKKEENSQLKGVTNNVKLHFSISVFSFYLIRGETYKNLYQTGELNTPI